MSSPLEQEISETQNLLSNASFAGVQAALQTHLNKLNKQLEAQNAAAAAAAAKSEGPSEFVSAPVTSSSSSSRPAVAGTFVPVEDFAWDQGEYNTPTITVYAEIPDVGSAKDRVQVDFTKHGFDLRVTDLHGEHYRLLKDNLEKDIVPQDCSFSVKKNKVVLKLRKVKGEFSYEHWTSLTAKKKREEGAADTKKDPMGGIMDMMKNMYEEGDENMKKIIGEAMLKSQRGEKPSMDDL